MKSKYSVTLCRHSSSYAVDIVETEIASIYIFLFFLGYVILYSIYEQD